MAVTPSTLSSGTLGTSPNAAPPSPGSSLGSVPGTLKGPTAPGTSLGQKPAPSSATAPAHLNRDQILDATAKCLQNLGYEATTIRRIALELGCAVGSIYRYFRDKSDLLYAVSQRSLETVARFAESGGPINHCERLYMDEAWAAGQMYQLMFWLACFVDSPRPGASGPVPGVVNRILEAWSRQLGSIEQARVRWVRVHGQVVLGSNGHLPVPHLSGVAVSAHEVIGSDLRALSTPTTGHGTPPDEHRVETPPAVPVASDSPDEDVTLL